MPLLMLKDLPRYDCLIQAAEQFRSDSAAACFRQNFQRLDVGDEIRRFPAPLDNGEAEHLGAGLGDPRGRVRLAENLSHVGATEALGRLEASLFNRIERGKVLRGGGAVEHRPTLPHLKETEARAFPHCKANAGCAPMVKGSPAVLLPFPLDNGSHFDGSEGD